MLHYRGIVILARASGPEIEIRARHASAKAGVEKPHSFLSCIALAYCTVDVFQGAQFILRLRLVYLAQVPREKELRSWTFGASDTVPCKAVGAGFN